MRCSRRGWHPGRPARTPGNPTFPTIPTCGPARPTAAPRVEMVARCVFGLHCIFVLASFPRGISRISRRSRVQSSKGNCSSLVFVLGASRLLDFSTGRLLDRAWSRIDAMGSAGGIGGAVGAPVRAELVRTLVHLSVWAQLGVVCREYLTRFFINGCDGSSWGPCCTFVPCVHPAGGLLLGHVLCRLSRLSRLSRYCLYVILVSLVSLVLIRISVRLRV